MVCTLTTGSANTTVTANYSVPGYTLTIDSTNPASGVAVSASASDLNGKNSGGTPVSLMYAPGTSVTVTAPATAGGNTFLNWTGCSSTTTTACSVTLNANTTITANYGATYTITIDSADPTSGAAVSASQADLSGKTRRSHPFHPHLRHRNTARPDRLRHDWHRIDL